MRSYSSFLDCVPESSNYASDSESARTAVQLRELLQKSAEELREMFHGSAKTANSDATTDVPELAEVGLRIGDRVMVGGVKVLPRFVLSLSIIASYNTVVALFSAACCASAVRPNSVLASGPALSWRKQPARTTGVWLEFPTSSARPNTVCN